MDAVNQQLCGTGNAIKYDGYWLYKRGQATDGDPGTTGDKTAATCGL